MDPVAFELVDKDVKLLARPALDHIARYPGVIFLKDVVFRCLFIKPELSRTDHQQAVCQLLHIKVSFTLWPAAWALSCRARSGPRYLSMTKWAA